MQTFKRFGLYVLGIALIVALVSAAFIVPWLHAPINFHDQALRGRLAGQIDTLIIGQSFAMTGIVPGKLDGKLGTHTYNLSGSIMPINGQAYMMEKELARNPVQYVILEITPETLTSDIRSSYGNGHSYNVARLDSLPERLDYLLRCVDPSDWPNIYAHLLLRSVRSMAYRLLGRMEYIDESNMGFEPKPVNDVTLEQDGARAQHRSFGIFQNPREENIRAYEALIELCLNAGCEVTIVYTPVSHAKVWQLYDQDKFLTWARRLADRYGVPLFDFNLLRDRYTLFSDAVSFYDDSHLSVEGAQVFSGVMADVLLAYRAGEDVSPRFYDSYEEVVHDSVYWGR